MLLLILFLIAWKWPTHENIISSIHNQLDLETQGELNLTLMKEGAIAPDKDFKDTVNHHYPPSYKLAQNWLNKARYYYSTQNYEQASYAFGVASHYIDDSFVAPHNINGESSQDHSDFEEQPQNYFPKTKCYNVELNLEQELITATKNKKDWSIWLNNRDPNIPENEIEQAMPLLFHLAITTFDASCIEPTKVNFEKKIYSYKIIIWTAGIFSIIIYLILNLLKN